MWPRYKKYLAKKAYTGFVYFTKKLCGNDFLQKFRDGTVNFDIFDYTAEYIPQYRYYRWERTIIDDKILENVFRNEGASTDSITLQYSRPEIASNTLGNTKKDQLYLQITGLDQVDFGNKAWKTCLEGGIHGVGLPELADEDQTPCVAWQV